MPPKPIKRRLTPSRIKDLMIEQRHAVGLYFDCQTQIDHWIKLGRNHSDPVRFGALTTELESRRQLCRLNEQVITGCLLPFDWTPTRKDMTIDQTVR